MNISRILAETDGRTVLFLTVSSCFVTFMSTTLLNHALYTFGVFLILCLFGLTKQGICCFGLYVLSATGLKLETKYGISFPSPLLLGMIYKFTLPAMPAYLLSKIPSGKLTASLRKLPIPSRFLLILIVMMRFTPTIINEFREVKDAMKIRGYLKSTGSILGHPLNTLEYVIVPIVFRSLTIADELTASAIVRGIECPCKKESYYVSHMNGLDLFLVMGSMAAAVFCIL